MQGLGFLADDFDLRSGALKVLLQFQGIALDREIQIADGQSGQDVTNRPARQVDIHAMGAGRFLHQTHHLQLIRCEPDFHRVNVVSHSC